MVEQAAATKDFARPSATDVDIVIVGAGILGLNQLYIAREAGYSIQMLEQGDGVDHAGTEIGQRGPCLRTAIAAHLHTLLGRDDYIAANIRIFGQVPDRVRTEALAYRWLYEAWWQDLLDQGAREGAFLPGTDLRLVRLFLMGAMNWSLEWHHFSGQDSAGPDSGEQDVDAIADRLAAMVLHGVSAAPAPG